MSERSDLHIMMRGGHNVRPAMAQGQGNAMAKEEKLDDVLKKRARRAILKNAFWRWESAVLIALTLSGGALLSLVALVGLVSWLWPLAVFAVGSVAWTAVFTSSLSDDDDNARAVAKALREQYNPKRLQSLEMRKYLGRAWEYRDKMTETILGTRDNVLRDRLKRVVEPVDEWIEQIYRLAVRVDSYEWNRVIKQDMQSVPKTLRRLEQQLNSESSDSVKETLRQAIADKERQQQKLNQLRETKEKAGYQLESTLAMLGTIYAQLQSLDIKEAERGRAEELRLEIDEQVHQLQDLGQAMDEVYYSGSSRGSR